MTNLSEEELRAIDERLSNLRGGRDEELIQQHAKAGVSMYGRDPLYPDEIIELAPDGRKFIIRMENDKPVRVREVNA